jgi:hypothetical protein
MIIKHKLYKIALVSIVMVLMLVSTAGAARYGNVILTTDNATQSVDFLKFPACGCDHGFCGCGDHSWDHSCNDNSSDKDKSSNT